MGTIGIVTAAVRVGPPETGVLCPLLRIKVELAKMSLIESYRPDVTVVDRIVLGMNWPGMGTRSRLGLVWLGLTKPVSWEKPAVCSWT